MLLNVLVSEFLFIYVSYARYISGNELRLTEDKNVTNEGPLDTILDDLNQKLEFIEFCKSTNLNVLLVTDSQSYSVKVSFELSHPKFKDCYEYYKITLKKGRKVVDNATVRYKYDEQKSVSFEFKNITCGIYEITFKPCYNTWQCAFTIRYPELINMTSNKCIGLVIRNKLIFEERFEKKIIIIIAVSSVFFIFAVGGLIFCYRRSVYDGQTDKVLEDELIDIRDDGSPSSSIEVYIIYFYGRNIKNKQKIEAFKDFCLMSGYYRTVKTIEDELSLILLNVNHLLSKMLEKRGKDGSLKKIVVIAPDEDQEDKAHELENIIFYQFIDKVLDNIEECLRGYDHFFVVKLDNSINCPEILEDIVRRSRFTLSEEMIEDHLIDLCLNLCSGSNLNMSSVERNLRKLLTEHPIRYSEG